MKKSKKALFHDVRVRVLETVEEYAKYRRCSHLYMYKMLDRSGN